MPRASLTFPPNVPRSVGAPPFQIVACAILRSAVGLLHPTTCPALLMALAWLCVPPKVPRLVGMPLFQIVALWGDAPDFVELGEAGIAMDDAMRRQRRVQLVG